jgi:antitoxin ParD1/3/4
MKSGAHDMSRNPSVSLTPHQQKFVAELVESGRFQGVSEVMRAGLRLLEEQEEKRKAFIARLEQAVEEGLASGDPVPFEGKDFMLGRYRKNARARK